MPHHFSWSTPITRCKQKLVCARHRSVVWDNGNCTASCQRWFMIFIAETLIWFLSDPGPIIVTHLVSKCCRIFHTCCMDVSKFLYVCLYVCICQRCQMYFSLSANYTKLKFNHDFEACASAFQLIWFWSLQELLVSAKALKHSMRLYDIFKIWTLRRRHRKQGRISNFKWLEAALNLVEIKNPFGSVQTNPQADAWWVPLFIFLKKCFFETP